MHKSNNIHLTTTSQVTHQTKFLSNNELKLLSLGPKFIMTEKIDDKLLLDIGTNFCRTAEHGYSRSRVNSMTKTTTNTNTFPV